MSLHWPGTGKAESAESATEKPAEPEEEFVFRAPERIAPGALSDPLSRMRQQERQELVGELAHLMRLPRCLGGRG